MLYPLFLFSTHWCGICIHLSWGRASLGNGRQNSKEDENAVVPTQAPEMGSPDVLVHHTGQPGHTEASFPLHCLPTWVGEGYEQAVVKPWKRNFIDLEGIMLSEISQTEKEKYHTISLTCGI